jgi:DMSO/TMAO reductase YedYZ heme-binding membrane subunit
MIKLLLNFLTFLTANCPLLMSLLLMTLLFYHLAGSIKKRPAIYYTLFALPALLFLARQIGAAAFDSQILTFPRGSFMGQLLREYVHVSGFAYPLLIIIMFIGALPATNPCVKRLMMIRKELSIICGFPILVHAWARLRLIPGAYGFFFGETPVDRVHSGIGLLLTNSAYLLGILMALLFLILWITSFDVIHKMLGGLRWKKIQRWSYVLYAMLFIHSVLLSVSRLTGGGGGHGHGGGGGGGGGARSAISGTHGGSGGGHGGGVGGHPPVGDAVTQSVGNIHSGSGAVIQSGGDVAAIQGSGNEAVIQSLTGSDINYAAIIALASTCIIFITYLILRLRKAKRDAGRRPVPRMAQ